MDADGPVRSGPVSGLVRVTTLPRETVSAASHSISSPTSSNSMGQKSWFSQQMMPPPTIPESSQMTFLPSTLFSFAGFKTDERDSISSSDDNSNKKPEHRKSHRHKKRRMTDMVTRLMKVRVYPNAKQK